MTAPMSRRSLVIAAPAAVAGAMAAAEGASPLRALYHEWRAIKLAYAQMPDDVSPEEDDRLFGLMVGVEQQAADFTPETLEDLWFKVIFADDDGDMAGNIHQEALVAQAYQAVGIERPQGRL